MSIYKFALSLIKFQGKFDGTSWGTIDSDQNVDYQKFRDEPKSSLKYTGGNYQHSFDYGAVKYKPDSADLKS